ncbi:MAG: hypothetical protein MJ232_02520 [archaeon]|nr:hypothetical protein [archaeon]
MKILNGIKNYLTDWKNLLTHSLVGIALLLIAIYAPVPVWVRVLFLVIVVMFNVIRMKYFK